MSEPDISVANISKTAKGYVIDLDISNTAVRLHLDQQHNLASWMAQAYLPEAVLMRALSMVNKQIADITELERIEAKETV